MSHINSTNNKVCLNPLAENNAHNNGHSGMTHTDNGLRAASHVSMENTIHAHEYQPTCPCADCQALLHNFTQYEILDAYTAHHLRFEASIRAAYGYVPAIGSALTYVVKPACVVGRDERTGAEIVAEQQIEYTNSYLFHMHLHHMKPVPAEVRERSYQRFFDNNTAAPAVIASNNNNNHQQQQSTMMMAVPAPRNFKQNNNNNGGLSRAFATHQNVYQPNKNNNNNNSNVRRQNNNNQQQQSFYNNNDYSSNNFQNYYAAANNNQFHYTASDVEQAKQSVAFSGIATLGN